MNDHTELRKLQDIIDKQADRILDLEAALRLAHEWLDPTEMPDADYYTIRAALAPEQDKCPSDE